MNTRRWQEFWQDKDDPLHRRGEDFARRHAAELGALLPTQARSVLEYACGNGQLFELLGFDSKRYVGVDFSAAMIDSFVGRYPDTDVTCADAESYRRDEKFEVIFSNGFIQYLDPGSLSRLTANAVEMLTEDGVIIHASVPAARTRWAYALGDRSLVPGGMSPRQKVRSVTAEVLGRSAMGTWWSARRIEALCREHRLTAEYFGSLVYPYRFHVVMRREPERT